MTPERSNSHRELEETANRIAGLERQRAELTVKAREKREEIKDAFQKAGSAGFEKPLLKRVVRELLDKDEAGGIQQLEMELKGECETEMRLDTYREALDLPTKRDARRKVGPRAVSEV